MTSRSSFFKLLKEDLRQRLWTIVLASIVFLLPVPISIAMNISGSYGYVSGINQENFSRNLASSMGMSSSWLIMVTLVGALICAVNGFGYLFSKKKVDFFHALPVKREALFAVKYINGVLIYVVPYVAMVLVSFAIIAVTGNFRAVVFTVALKGFVVHLLGYLTIYTTLILGVTFAGNIVVFFGVSGWILGITVVSLGLYCWLEEMFFDTYSYMGDVFMERLVSLRFLCPGYFYVAGATDATVSMLVQQLLFTLVLVAVTLLVYRVRPSDGAGKAIAFPVLKPVIRVSVEILAGGLVGILFYNMADSSRGVPGWMIFGGILGVVLSHMLIQSIFHFDVRKCFAGKASMLGCAVAAVAITLVMRYDVFGYDAYLPKEKKLASVGIEISSFDSRRDDFRHNGKSVEWFDEASEMKLTNIEAVYPYLEALIEDSRVFYEAQDNGERKSGYTRVSVAYRLKSGKTVYREYYAEGMREDLFAKIFESPEYKEIHYADIYTVPENLVYSVTARMAMNEQVMNLSDAEKAELMSILRRELSTHTLNEKLTTLPVAILELQVLQGESSYGARTRVDGGVYEGMYKYTSELPIYASFTETLRFLKERGFDAAEEYQWTGQELMRLEIPYKLYDKETGLIGWDSSSESYYYDGEKGAYVSESAEETDYYLLGSEVRRVIATEDWAYGDNVIPVEPEEYERLYELCTWEELLAYGDPTVDKSYNCSVYLEVPQEGYNMYETYGFEVPLADVTFLFD